MASINISFNNKNYTIDEASFATAYAKLQSHLTSVMNGSGAKVSLGGVSYNIDSAKLSAATTTFVTHLGTISGTGSKVVVNGTEYSISSEKIADAVDELETVLGDLQSIVEFHVREDGKLIIVGAMNADSRPDGLYLDCAPKSNEGDD